MNSQPTRRQFLTASLAMVAASAVNPKQTIAPSSFTIDQTGATPKLYPDSERLAVLENWERFLDETLIKIERLWSFVHDAKYQPPGGIDSFQFVELEHDALDAANDLGHRLEMIDMEKLGKALTGKSAFFTYASHYLEIGDGSRESWQRDIDSHAEKHPEDAVELQRVLDTRFGAKAVCS